MPAGTFEGLTPEKLNVIVVDDRLNDPTSPLRVTVTHHVEATYEYVFLSVDGGSNTSFTISVTPGSVATGNHWRCATGLQSSSAGSPHPFKDVPAEGDTWPVGKRFDLDAARAAEGLTAPSHGAHSDREGVTCQRTGDIFVRKAQGLVLLAPAAVRATLPGHVSADLGESMELPPGWELLGHDRQYSTSEAFGQSDQLAGGYSFESSPERASQNSVSSAIGGLHLARDTIAESEQTKLAWSAALVGGAGAGLLVPAANDLFARRRQNANESAAGSGATADSTEQTHLDRAVRPALILLVILALVLSQHLGRWTSGR